MKLSGVWIPLITPFENDELDFKSYKRLIDYYIGKGVSGIIPLGTTGESPTICEDEFEEIVMRTMEYVSGRIPVIVGLGGNDTKKVVKQLKIVERSETAGILSVCPYYNRPDQRGIYEHFKRISESTSLNIVIYNIPYRTGRNIENNTIRRLAELKNVIGVKDSCGDIKQTSDLLLSPPSDFSILTGEDALFFTTLALGGDGGILASSHLHTSDFIKVYNDMKANNHQEALKVWKELAEMIPLLFEEPNPSPLKYCLYKLNLIASPEVRLPLTEISEALKIKLDKFLI